MPVTTQNLLIEFVYWVDANGVQYPLFGGNRALLSWDNFGLPPLHYLSDKGPNQHGRTIRDYRFSERTVNLRLYESGCRRMDWYSHEAALVDAIRPNRSSTAAPGKLLVINQDNIEREITARIESGPDGDWSGQGSLSPADLMETLTFVCEDPFWRDPTINVSAFAVSLTSSCIANCLPFCLGGTSVISNQETINYTGTWNGDQIIIEYTGPMESPTISNLTTNQQILLNYTIASNEAVTINITPTLTTVTNNFGANLIGVVDNPSDLVTFYLATAGDLTSNGDNLLAITAAGADSTSSINFSYYTRDISLFVPD